MAIGLIVSVCLLIMAIIYQYRAIKIKALKDQRRDQLQDRAFDYEAHFISKGYDPRLVRAFRESLLIALRTQNFPILPEDNFYKDYDLFETNVRDVLTDVSMELDFPNPKTDEIEAFEKEHGKLDTVEQAIKFLAPFLEK